MERKLNIYRIYKDELGVQLNKRERDNVLNRFDSNSVELLMGRKMFSLRQEQAAIRIQTWWRKEKMFLWFRLVKRLRLVAATRIQRTWTMFKRNRLMPLKNATLQVKAAE